MKRICINWVRTLLFVGVIGVGLILLLSLIGCSSFFERQVDRSSYAGLRLTTEVDRASCLKKGDLVHVRFTVANDTNQAIVIESPDQPVIDITISPGFRGGSSHQTLYSWSAQNPDKVQHRIEWQPGESRAIEVTWTVPDFPVAPGSNAAIEGLLSEKSHIVGGASVTICWGGAFESGR